MRLSTEELRVLDQACADRGNRAANELVNLFGAASASDVMVHVLTAPRELRDELFRTIREAIDEQKRRIRR
jgi:hypothetical protein